MPPPDLGGQPIGAEGGADVCPRAAFSPVGEQDMVIIIAAGFGRQVRYADLADPRGATGPLGVARARHS